MDLNPKRAISWIDEHLEPLLLIIIFSYIIAVISLEVISRNIVGRSYSWTQPSAIWLHVIAIWIAAAYAARKRLHINIDFLHQYMPSRLKFGVVVTSNVLFLALILFLIYATSQSVQSHFTFDNELISLGLPTWQVTIWVPVAMALLALRISQNLVEDIRLYFNKGEFATGAPLFIEDEE